MNEEELGNDESRARRESREPQAARLDLPGLAGGRLELLLERDESGAFLDFVRVGQDLRFARTLLAELTTGGPAPIRQIALRIQRDGYDDEGETATVTNPEIEDLWEDEHRYLMSFARESQDSPALRYFALPGGEGGALLVLPPILFLSTAGVFFHPPCSVCGGALRDCRDQKLLATHGLAQFAATNRRYLYCDACAEKTPETVQFYRKLPSDAEQAAGVRTEFELYQDIKEKASGKKRIDVIPVGATTPSAIPADEFDPAAIVPLSFYDCRILPVEYLSVTYRQFCDCLGGIAWQQFFERHRGDLGSQAAIAPVVALRRLLSASDRFLFADSPHGMHAIEVFRLKLALMRQLAKAVEEYHRRRGLPHLGLDPDQILIDLPLGGGTQAALWNFKPRLAVLATAHRTVCGESEDATTVLARPAGVSDAFLPPFAASMQLYQVSRCELVPRALEEVSPGKFRVSFTLDCRTTDLTQFSRRDLFEVSVTGAPFRQRVSLYARPAGDTCARTMTLESLPVRLEAPQADVLRKFKDQPIRTASFRCFPAFHVPCDVYGMGYLFLMTLLGGANQDLDTIKKDLVEVVAAELKRTRDRSPNATPEELAELVRKLVRERDVTQPWRVAFVQDPEQANALPEELWERALLLSLRMCTASAGFSFCADRSDWPEAEPWRIMRDIGNILDGLCLEVHERLFGAAPAVDVKDVLVATVRRVRPEFPAVGAGDPRRVDELAARLRKAAQTMQAAYQGRPEGERSEALAHALREELASEKPECAALALDALAPRVTPQPHGGPTIGELHNQIASLKEQNARLQAELKEYQAEVVAERDKLRAAVRKALEGPKPVDAEKPLVERACARPELAAQALTLLVAASNFASDVNRNVRGLFSKEFLGIEAKIPSFTRLLCLLKDYDRLGEYLQTIRACMKAVAVTPSKAAEDWAADLRKALAPDRFLPKEKLAPAKAVQIAWDAYNDFYRHFNFEADLLPRIKAAVETQVIGPLRQLARYDTGE